MGSRPVGHGHAGGMLGPVRDEEDEPRVSRRPRRNMRRLLPYFRPYRRRVIWTIILMLVVTAAGLACRDRVRVRGYRPHGLDRRVLAVVSVVMGG